MVILLALLLQVTPAPGVRVQDEGTFQCQAPTINFAGAGVSVSSCTAGTATITIAGGAGGYSTIDNEGVPLTQRTTLNFIGTAIDCVDDAIGAETDCTVTAGSGSFALTNIEKDLGTTAQYAGTFDITGLSGLTPGANVLVAQAAGPYTGKGDRQDEAEMDLVTATGYVVDANTIRVYWNCNPHTGPMIGNVKFNYVVG